MNGIERKDRIIYLDFLRIAACFAVIALHVAASGFEGAAVGSYRWNVFNIIDSAVRCAVPVFVMISGSVFLDPKKEIGLKTLFGKYVLRMAVAFVFWSGLYAAVQYFEGVRLRTVANNFVTGGSHLWFLYMIAGLYVVSPLLRKITESKKTTYYFLALWVASSVLYNTLRAFSSVIAPRITPWIDSAAEESSLYMAYGYTGFFVLGRYLHENDLSKKVRRVIYILGLAGAAFTAGATYFCSRKSGILNETFFNNMSVGVVLEAVAVFVFFKYNVRPNASEKTQKILERASKFTFGMYLVHLMIVNHFDKLFGFGTRSFDPILSFLAVFCVVTVCSAAVSFILNLIPGIKKYLV